MQIFRFAADDGAARIGGIRDDGAVVDLTRAGVSSLASILEHDDPAAACRRVMAAAPVAPDAAAAARRTLAPVERQEVWAAGVTYLRSKTARMEESDFSATAYDRVYDADRPELFFKSLPEKAIGPNEPVGIRRDGRWNVPEPELALVMS